MNKLTLKKLAFTLAEVLITLGIIGIVAEMTIPTLISDFQKKAYYTQFKTTYSLWGQALGLMKSNNNVFSVSGLYSTTDEALDGFCSVTKCVKKCYTSATAAEKAQCFHAQSDWKKLDKTTGWENYSTMNNFASGILTNGTSFTMNLYPQATCSSGGICVYFVVDTNGIQKPNTMGRDMFFMYFNQGIVNVGGGKGDWAYYPDNNNYCNPSVAGVDYAGFACAGRLLIENEMNY